MKINVIGMILNNMGRRYFEGLVLDDHGKQLPAADSLHMLMVEYAKVMNGGTSHLVVASREVLTVPTPQPEAPADEPFGYFRAEPFGWVNCAETEEGAVALYDRPAPPAAAPNRKPQAWLCELAQEDGAVRRMLVDQDPDGLRFGDMEEGLPSPFRVTPLYAAPKPVVQP